MVCSQPDEAHGYMLDAGSFFAGGDLLRFGQATAGWLPLHSKNACR